MIVKKVPPSKAAGPKSVAANVRDLADYIAGPTAGGDSEKVEHRGALNFLNVDHGGQVEEMIGLAEIARRDAKPVQHWILSWRESEQPTATQVDEAVNLFLGEMGLSDHQTIYALHSDTNNWHLHLAVNRVHPETERVVTVNKGYDVKVAHRAIARIELRQHWESEARPLYAPDSNGEIKPVIRREAERQPSTRAMAFEERVGARAPSGSRSKTLAPIVRRAGTWRELHDALAKAGTRFEKKGSGALLWVGDQPVKASAAGRDCSMSALRKTAWRVRTGTYTRASAGPSFKQRRPPATRRVGPVAVLLPGAAR